MNPPTPEHYDELVSKIRDESFGYTLERSQCYDLIAASEGDAVEAARKIDYEEYSGKYAVIMAERDTLRASLAAATERADEAERYAEHQRRRADGCEGAFNTMANCQDTLRARDFCEGALDERVIAMAKALDAAREASARWERLAGKYAEVLAYYAAEEHWDDEIEATEGGEHECKVYTSNKSTFFDSCDGWTKAKEALAATASEQGATVHADTARKEWLIASRAYFVKSKRGEVWELYLSSIGVPSFVGTDPDQLIDAARAAQDASPQPQTPPTP